MKRLNNIYSKIYSTENLRLADEKARKGKLRQYGVMIHDKNKESNIISLHHMLRDKTYKTSAYTKFTVHEPKERIVYRLPYFPDRIGHHAVMNQLEPIFCSFFTADTYSCIKGRGIHAAVRNVKKALKDETGTQYCLKLDITKFYPNIDHEILKQLLRKKFKDADLLWLLDEIIDSAEGVPIGNYLSQYFANFYLTWFDRWIKDQQGAKYYFRYADDIVVLSDSKEYLHNLLAQIKQYLSWYLKLNVKDNYQIFPVESRGIDFLGYVFRHKYTKLRPRIKRRFVRMAFKNRSPESMASYYGWAKHADCKHLLKKINYEAV